MKKLNFSVLSSGERIDRLLAELFPEETRSAWQRKIRSGEVGWVHGGEKTFIKNPSKILKGREEIFIFLGTSPRKMEVKPQKIPLDILYEDAYVWVINKEAGLVVHPAPGHREGTLLNGLLALQGQDTEGYRCGLVHRLDKETSGALLVAKSERVYHFYQRLLAERKIHRSYAALVCGGDFEKERGRIRAPIARDPGNRLKQKVIMGGRQAVTHFRVLYQNVMAAVLRIELETGRTHQIRVHMEYIGHPVWADPVYHGREKGKNIGIARQALHAFQLEFPSFEAPEKMLSVKAPCPDDFLSLLRGLQMEEALQAWDSFTDEYNGLLTGGA